MIVAIPIWQGRISPVLDVAERVLLCDIELEECAPEMLSLEQQEPMARAEELKAAGVDLVICGAVSRELELALVARQITLRALCCGDVDEVLQACRRGDTRLQSFGMPGCRQRRRRGHCGGRACSRHDQMEK